MNEWIDPVCGMKVQKTSSHKLEQDGKTFYFCSNKCEHRFRENPGAFSVEKARSSRNPGSGSKVSDYVPLVVLLVTTLLAASARQLAGPSWDWTGWMHDFMGFFLVVFSMFKLFDLRGFADGYSMYDLLARKFRGWAYLYPFIELALGLAYLARLYPAAVYTTTFTLLAFGALGVLLALRRGLDLECACMGSVLHVPLSTVALVEDLGMAAMAGTMLGLSFR